MGERTGEKAYGQTGASVTSQRSMRCPLLCGRREAHSVRTAVQTLLTRQRQTEIREKTDKPKTEGKERERWRRNEGKRSWRTRWETGQSWKESRERERAGRVQWAVGEVKAARVHHPHG